MSPYGKSVVTVETWLHDIGMRIAKLRLSRNITQSDLARESGASVSSIKRLESGENTSLDTVFRVLGALGLADRLLQCLPDPDIRPIERIEHGGRERRRARETNKVPKASDWAWGDEEGS